MVRHREDVRDAERRCDPLRSTAHMRLKAHQTLMQNAAALVHSLVANHALVDGTLRDLQAIAKRLEAMVVPLR